MLELAHQESSEDEHSKLMEKRMRAIQIEMQKKSLIRRYMTTEAYERLMNVRVANYDVYSQLLDLIIAMAQSNRITSHISEAQLKQILAKMTQKRESSLEFRHK